MMTFETTFHLDDRVMIRREPRLGLFGGLTGTIAAISTKTPAPYHVQVDGKSWAVYLYAEDLLPLAEQIAGNCPWHACTPCDLAGQLGCDACCPHWPGDLRQE